MWRLCRYTVLVGALDSNTDSNTRQRDLCNLDAMLASRYQGAVAALAAEHPRRQVANLQSNLPSNLPSNSSIEPSEHPRRQVAATLSTPQAFTNDRTLEFNMATVAAVYFHALEYSDYANNSGTATAESVAACFFFQDLGLGDLAMGGWGNQGKRVLWGAGGPPTGDCTSTSTVRTLASKA